MPSFCRHGRFEANCPICAKKAAPAPAARSRPARAPRAPRTASGSAPARRGRADVAVRRMERAPDDGYEHELVPGLRATADARRLAGEVALAAERLRVLAEDPPGLYAEVATAADPLEGAWLACLIAVLSPLEDGDPWATIGAVRTTFASGAIPEVGPDVALGPRAARDPGAALTAFGAWLGRPDALAAGDPLPASRRFDRLYERLGLPGLARAQRYEYLVLLGALGVADVEAATLRLGEAGDETTQAAKRVFGIGDVVLLGTRAAALAAALDVPVAALDLALVNWARPQRIGAGVPLAGDENPAGVALAPAAAAALGL